MAPFEAAERGLYRLAGVDASAGMGWRAYAVALLVFNGLGVLAVYALQRCRPAAAEPAGMAGGGADSAFNTAISFVTNTNWQGYGGESDDELPDPDAGAGGAELPVGGDRHRGGGALIRGFARHSRRRHDRQLLGRHDPRHAVCAAAAVAGAGLCSWSARA
jgi:K+-transporting ATPase A subunit